MIWTPIGRRDEDCLALKTEIIGPGTEFELEPDQNPDFVLEVTDTFTKNIFPAEQEESEASERDTGIQY